MNIYQLYPKNLKDITLTLPCSKSIVNRIIPLSVYSDVPLHVRNVTLNTDIETCLHSIRELGFSASYNVQDCTLSVKKKSGVKNKSVHLYVGPSGTTLRFMTALAPFLADKVSVNGDDSLRKRPVQDLLEVLEQQLGIEIEYHEKHGHLPFTLISSNNFPKTKHLTVKADKSSQFASALLMILPYLGEGATLTVLPPVHSYSYIALTLQVMHEMGFDIEEKQDFTYLYTGRSIYSEEISYTAEADWSAATFWYGYTALSGKKSTLIGLNSDSKQGERNIQYIMQKMGVNSEFNAKNELEIFPPQTALQAIDADLTLLPDATPMLAVLCGFAQGKSTLIGLQTLVYKETNRIKALVQELNKMNILTEHTSDSLTVYGTHPQNAIIETYKDHRIAMAFAMAGLKVPYLSVIDPNCVAKSYSRFWEDYKKTGMLILHRKTVI